MKNSIDASLEKILKKIDSLEPNNVVNYLSSLPKDILEEVEQNVDWFNPLKRKRTVSKKSNSFSNEEFELFWNEEGIPSN